MKEKEIALFTDHILETTVKLRNIGGDIRDMEQLMASTSEKIKKSRINSVYLQGKLDMGQELLSLVDGAESTDD